MAGNGDPAMQTGCAVHIYAANQSMSGRFFANADGEMLIVPQLGKLRFFTELGILEVAPGESACSPAVSRFASSYSKTLPAATSARTTDCPSVCPTWVRSAPTGWRTLVIFFTPWPPLRMSMANFRRLCKFQGRLWSAGIDHSPLDVVGWHGNYAPYKYDMANFNCINTVSFDHPDPSIYTVLTAPTPLPGTANVDFAIFPPRWMVAEHTFRPPWFHRNAMNEFMGLIFGQYDAKAEGFVPGSASLHSCMQAHGPDAETFERAAKAELKPHYLGDTLAFMFETQLVLHPTRFALETDSLQRDYFQVWQALKKHFTGSPVRINATMNATHDPERQSWVASANRRERIPDPKPAFWRFPGQLQPTIGVAIGDQILDLRGCCHAACWPRSRRQPERLVPADTLNPLMALGPECWSALRARLSDLLRADHPHAADHQRALAPHLVAMADATMLKPAQIGDYTDFYASIDHATNVGRLFRPDNPLLPNYKYVPIGYHGRASSIVRQRRTGEAARRARFCLPPGAAPHFAPSQALDYEMEAGFFVGPGNQPGRTDCHRARRLAHLRRVPAE